MRVTVQAGAHQGQSLEVTGRLEIGREPDCALVLDDDNEVSRRHAYLSPLPDGRLEIGDLGSRNGTYVNGQRLSGPVALSGGERIRIGGTELLAEAGPAPGAEAPTAVAPPAAEDAIGQAVAAEGRHAGESTVQRIVMRVRDQLRTEQAGRRGQSTIQRVMLQRSVRRATLLAGGAVAIAAVVVVLAVAGVFSSGGGPPSGADVVNAVRPSVVQVLADVNGTPKFTGTGWAYNAAQGLIVTNAHVVGGGSTYEVVVNGQRRPATLVGDAPCMDLAVLKVSDTSGLQTIPLGSQSDIHQADTVFAIGFPTNFSTKPELQVTSGVVSVVQESADLGPKSGDPDLQTYPNVIQTSAAINHGNSGGPLVDENKDLVGVNTLSDPQTQNQGYAIGVDLVKNVVPKLAQGNSIGWLGFDFTAQGNGLLVSTATAGTPAAKAGFGSEPALITTIGGQRVGTRNGYCKLFGSRDSGTTTVSGITRSGLTFSKRLSFNP